MRIRMMACVALTCVVGGYVGAQETAPGGAASQPAMTQAGTQAATRPDWSHLPPVTVDHLQYDGVGPYQLFDRPVKNQGLDTLLSRGRVAPEDLLAAAESPAKTRDRARTRDSARTIFHDQYTHAEVWRLTDFPFGVVRHTYSGVPAWNANGRYIEMEYVTHGEMLFDQEKCTLHFGEYKGEWSPTDPDLMVRGGKWQDKRAVVVFDIAQNKVLRGLGPVRQYAGVAPLSADGKWVCWREGAQDTGTSFGLAAVDGSSFKSICIDGGIVAEQTPVTFAPLPDAPGHDKVPNGIHQMYFTRRADESVMINANGPTEPHGHIIAPEGKVVTTFAQGFIHMAWAPGGEYVLYLKAGVNTMDPDVKKPVKILDVANSIEAHTSWNDRDPNWAGMSWRSKFAGEILRISMRDDHSVARLCGTCPANPDTTAYDNDEFGCISPDGTKILFMSTMSGNVNEYLVVGANPHTPTLAGKWKEQGYELTITPNAVAKEIKGYRVYRTNKSGQDYQEIGFAAAPQTAPVGAGTPVTFLVKRLAKGDGGNFAVRAQEWSGLVSRYSNEAAAKGGATAGYIEPELLAFTGFLQGFDAVGASDLYYLFVPKADEACAVTFENPQAGAVVYARVAGKDVAFSVNGKAVEKKSYPEWTWVSLGNVSGAVKIESQSAGFKLDRIFITPDAAQVPQGKGLDYLAEAVIAAAMPGDVAAQGKSPFAVEVTWKPVAGARYYNVYASDHADFVPAQGNLLYSPPVGTERVIDWGLKPNTGYFYRVVAVDYDGAVSQASAAAEGKTGVLLMPDTTEIACSTAAGAEVENQPDAAGGKGVIVEKGHECEVKFTIPEEGDYVIWHDFMGDNGRGVRLAVLFDEGEKAQSLEDTYDLVALRGKALHKEYEWSRFTFRDGQNASGTLHFTKGEHRMVISTDQKLHLDRVIITNDLSLVPKGRLGTF